MIIIQFFLPRVSQSKPIIPDWHEGHLDNFIHSMVIWVFLTSASDNVYNAIQCFIALLFYYCLKVLSGKQQWTSCCSLTKTNLVYVNTEKYFFVIFKYYINWINIHLNIHLSCTPPALPNCRKVETFCLDNDSNTMTT